MQPRKKGRFILSINDRPQIRETRYSANAGANRRVTELLVSGAAASPLLAPA